MKKTIGMVSLGCPKNLVDSENMLGIARKSNYIVTNEPSESEIIIVNTCGFIETAKEESIETVLQMAEYKKTGKCKYLILAGCLGERYAKELLEEIPEVDAVIGSHAWSSIDTVLERVLSGERFIFTPENADVTKENQRIITTKNHTAYLKISEGCDNDCSYCIIPKLRGPYKSRTMEDILQEARELSKSGVKEIILVAQDVTRYGEDFYGTLMLPTLLEELVLIEEIKWIRILYAYPQYITDKLISVMAKYDKICNYIDIPLQHINNEILHKMNRLDRKEYIIILLGKLRKFMPDIVIRTTFIVGFPGEGEKEFLELKEFLITEKFDRVGIFTYSQEEGTAAAEMPQIGDDIKEERYHELMAVQAKISEEINLSLEGKDVFVIVDDIEKNGEDFLVKGRTYREAPEIDGIVYLENAENVSEGSIVKAKIAQGFTYDLLAEVVG